jgi:succinylglutamate desuccinylase
MAAVMHAPILIQSDCIPEGLLDVAAPNLHQILPHPSLIHLPGRLANPLFVSVLLHGNETTGLGAVQLLLKKYAGRPLPRSLSIFFGNIGAAREEVRRLEGQPDFNRVWPGTPFPPCEETALMRTVVDEMARRRVFASVDVHNNTGLNPHYVCITRLDRRFLSLAAMFGRLVIYFSHPKGTQTTAFAALCPAVTLECGKSGQEHGVEHAFEYLDACLHLSEIPDHPLVSRDVDLYRTVVQVMVRESVAFGFEGDSLDVRFNSNLDHLNFTDLPAGTVLGKVRDNLAGLPLRVWDESARDVAPDYFEVSGGHLILKKPVMPSMLTLDERIIRQDCLCYLMERISFEAEREPR